MSFISIKFFRFISSSSGFISSSSVFISSSSVFISSSYGFISSFSVFISSSSNITPASLLSYQGNCSAPERGGGGGEEYKLESSVIYI